MRKRLGGLLWTVGASAFVVALPVYFLLGGEAFNVVLFGGAALIVVGDCLLVY